MGYSPHELIKIMKKDGRELKRIKGSHHICFHAETRTTIPIPIHGKKDLGKGLYHSIEKIILSVKEDILET